VGLGLDAGRMNSEGELRFESKFHFFAGSLIQIEIRGSFGELLFLFGVNFRHSTDILFYVLG
jgi:hypothetical protein